MQIETGAFGDFEANGLPREVYAARVVIPCREFAHLGLGDFERPDAAPACFRWCVAVFGVGGPRWCVRLPEGSDAAVYFAEPADALAFHTRWSAASTDIRLAA
jgi:hypothetical protein